MPITKKIYVRDIEVGFVDLVMTDVDEKTYIVMSYLYIDKHHRCRGFGQLGIDIAIEYAKERNLDLLAQPSPSGDNPMSKKQMFLYYLQRGAQRIIFVSKSHPLYKYVIWKLRN